MNQDTGILIICIVACFHQASSETRVTGYIGQSVILKSGVDPSWKLERVQWSIYTNTTYIAIFENGKVETRSSRYKGRLSLNESSGDLEIKELKADDGMRYTVSLLSTTYKQQDNHISLTVLEQLRKPDIVVLYETLVKEDCIIALKCSSSKNNNILSWTPANESSLPFVSGKISSNVSELWMHFTPNRKVTFTCTATDGQRSASEQITVQCQEETLKTTPQPGCPTVMPAPCERYCHGIVASLVLLAFVIAIASFKDQIKKCILDAYAAVRGRGPTL
ncbi:T-lymphocyte surface antigen Ly-9-like isoform X2 [Pygocentrus nattereri]|uniref:T-lymphocyte surface antigen Ly-9-like isoform X2 n=1 Tax=Pygocentrus nattereri TaxID=42514 RepID=UPI0018914D17|nr:T-lymphocyte surface antigen Ly-9-like isoform X2 [Pygocentrus nattereri]